MGFDGVELFELLWCCCCCLLTLVMCWMDIDNYSSIFLFVAGYRDAISLRHAIQQGVVDMEQQCNSLNVNQDGSETESDESDGFEWSPALLNKLRGNSLEQSV